MLEIRKIDINIDVDNLKLIYEKTFERPEGVLSYFYKGFSDYINFSVQQGYAYIAIFSTDSGKL